MYSYVSLNESPNASSNETTLDKTTAGQSATGPDTPIKGKKAQLLVMNDRFVLTDINDR